MCRYVKTFLNSDYILEWKSKGLSDESIKSLSAPHNFINPSLNYLDAKTRGKFSESCLNQGKITYTYRKIVKTYIASEIKKMTIQAVIQH